MSLKEALKSQISPGTQENSPNNAPQLLPYREQTQPWWFQPAPQHYGSNVDFNADPTRRPYSSHFQQVVPEQFQQFAPKQHLQQIIPQQHQQPFPYQYQAGPFAMPSANSRSLDDEKRKLPGCKFDGGGGSLRIRTH
ncbi:hypothetical protein N7499_003013 [Penicillium canescens]|uniref:Uncharacterized protein n=1 Tax=Penicillium canescens TaxID=5083 RepID=A0AAD6IBD7_PENCN|nr:uncharacterized protein N7446_011891 [Penicillium canescens]KAJ6019860.1 hypothetical protein N7522_000568 [Penicillium canescens]KAJ6039168.1 hypothetical protein N7460_007200 [Penicillium canescens]KAJ6047057.1 hypothetical protein N7446_011891 [Penicillium canescens]KAJ6059805.1 hypothetical protein N7444_003444 [Penicillium canescens]KAJ6093682.1 hypothetical protein N7499_003013 [Penicillium canescens]